MDNFIGMNVFWKWFTPEQLFGITTEKYESIWDLTFQHILSGTMARIVVGACIFIAIYGISMRKLSPIMIYILYALAVFFAYGANIVYRLF